MWPHSRCIHRKRTTNMVLKINKFFNNKRVVSTFKFDYPHLTLKQTPKVKSEHIEHSLPMISYRLLSHLQTSKTKNKQINSTFKFGSPHLTLKEGPKVKSEHIRRFLAMISYKVGFTSKTSRTKNKLDISILTLAILI